MNKARYIFIVIWLLLAIVIYFIGKDMPIEKANLILITYVLFSPIAGIIIRLKFKK